MGKDPNKVVDTSRLNRVLHVDTDSQTALVEPNVPMDRLVEETLKYGLVPPVVMEFPGITVGGGFSGSSGESSSFKHGFFDRTLKQVEIVLADGEIVTCSEQENADLFNGAAGAVGTLGVVTALEMKLLKASKYVETTYHPVRSVEEAVSLTKELADPASDLDYVDAILFSRTNGAVITGRMTNDAKAGLPVRRFSDAKDPWYYLHVQDLLRRSSGLVTELIPLPEYLFRYDRGGFWVGAMSFKYFAGLLFNDFTRWWLDDLLHTRMLYKALHASGLTEYVIVQDLSLPYETATEFISFTDKRTGIWPIWLCPIKQNPRPTMNAHLKDGDISIPMLNIGLWGLGPSTQDDYVKVNQELEVKLRELGGMKILYAQTFCSEEDFWKDFDRDWHNGLREKYHATSLPSVYDKVKRQQHKLAEPQICPQRLLSMWPFPALYGLSRAIASKDYLIAQRSTWKNWVPR